MLTALGVFRGESSMFCDECLTGDRLYSSERALILGPRSLLEVDRGVNELGALGPYEKRFLCGVEGVRFGPASLEPFVGGVLARELDPSYVCTML